jgi:hypothetical protein
MAEFNYVKSLTFSKPEQAVSAAYETMRDMVFPDLRVGEKVTLIQSQMLDYADPNDYNLGPYKTSRLYVCVLWYRRYFSSK